MHININPSERFSLVSSHSTVILSFPCLCNLVCTSHFPFDLQIHYDMKILDTLGWHAPIVGKLGLSGEKRRSLQVKTKKVEKVFPLGIRSARFI